MPTWRTAKGFAIIAIAALLVAVAILSKTVVRLENYHYANFLGFCADFNPKDPQQRIEREKCLNATETRTRWFWHILYAIGMF